MSRVMPPAGFSLGGTPTTHTYAYDAVGNQTDDGKDYTYKYDVWGRLREVWTRGMSPVLKSEFRYNGLGYRIGWHYDVASSGGGGPDGVVNSDDPWFFWMHDERWRQIALFRADDDDPKERFVYHAAGLDGNGGSSYIDAVILRNRDNTDKWQNESDGVLEARHYICQNWRNDTALVATDAGELVENAKFTGYGETFNCPAGDINTDGVYNGTDAAAITGTYDALKDINMDGSVSAADLTAAAAVTGGYHTEGRGVLSAEEVGIRKGNAGYEIDPILTGSDTIAFLHHVRHRVLSSYTGRWNRRDPLGYVDGMGLYGYVQGDAIALTDSMGLDPFVPPSNISVCFTVTSNLEDCYSCCTKGNRRDPAGYDPCRANCRGHYNPTTLPPPSGWRDFHQYGYHCGGGYGSSYITTCRGYKVLEQQRCGNKKKLESWESDAPTQSCPIKNNIDKCCQKHDECAYKNCVSHRILLPKKACQKFCDARMCACLEAELPNYAGNVLSEEWHVIHQMRLAFCYGNGTPAEQAECGSAVAWE